MGVSQIANTPSTATANKLDKKSSYLTLAMVASSHAVTHMFSALMPIIYPRVMEQFGFGYAQLGFMVGLGNTLMSLLQGIYGFLTKVVLRRTLLGLGNILLAASAALMALTGGFVPFFLLNVLARISNSAQHPVGNSLVAEKFGKKLRGTAFAVNFAGGNAGTVLVPALGTLSVATLGWKVTLVLFSLFPLATGLLCFRAIPEQKTTGVTQEVGKNRILGAGKSFLAPLKDRNVFMVVLAATVAAGGRGIGVVMTYVPLYLQQGLKLNAVNYATLFTIMMVGSVVGPLIVGRISDSFGRKRCVVATYALSATATVTLLLSGSSMSRLVPAMIFLGLVVYSQSSQIQALLSDVTSKETRDMAYSVFFTVSYLAGALWSFILGLAIDKAGFTWAFILMAISYLAGLSALLPAKLRNSVS